MSNPLVQAFFVGRAIAEVLSEKMEVALTDAMSELGKLDAELKEQMRQFTDEVIERANRAAENVGAEGSSSTSVSSDDGSDVQVTIDDLRAEIALLRTELQKYRSGTV